MATITITSSHANSVTIESSLHLHVRQLTPQLYRLGPTVLFQYLAEVCGRSPDLADRLEVYVALGSETFDRRDLIRLVK